ncbi:MAG: GNAT family N-acetyltransferase [Rouxiella aceris]|uniref:tRNA(Met) cytidine acetyltransferase TmcA n=1 Tax=Rouxiella aceris TaxID=2703884 RepID=UPI002841D178|nr:GNAT family N-acetyltransferase [Rouxiella aceris]MDR3430551.1 GNAT family N-acetyltransferase [Rouxiella aceris]
MDEQRLTVQLSQCQQQMLRQGMRRLLILSGEAAWCEQQALQIIGCFSGDWLWVSDRPQPGVRTEAATAVRHLLGQECLHGVFDARESLNVEALAAFSGLLRAGSWLIMLVPPWLQWASRPDLDSLRWSEQSAAIATPRFINRFCQSVEADDRVLLWRQHQLCQVNMLAPATDWFLPTGEPTPDQQAILAQLLPAEPGIWVLTAARGRGKSTLAGMLVQQWPGSCWLCAPSRAAGQRLSEQSGQAARFWAPDALLAYCESGAPVDADWLLIDEAAAIPTPLLTRLLVFFPRVLLTTTVQGYEGTGRGFLLKFCASLAQWHDLRLEAPVRWASHDPLETLLDDILLSREPPALPADNSAPAPMAFLQFDATTWDEHPERLSAFYSLLTSAHYRTTPLDLRRLLDAPGMSFAVACQREQLVAALWLVEEGGLAPSLAHEIWAGRRRPRGNLVAQSLAAHGGFPAAAVMRSRRVSRIAVVAACRRQGVARQLIAAQCEFAATQGLDYLSVSFGFTEALGQFWQACGFQLVRVGGQREASSGCYAAMAILPLSAEGSRLCQLATEQLCRDRAQLPREVASYLPLVSPSPADPDNSALNEADWRELAGFAYAHRSLDSSRSALRRLLALSVLALPTLRASVERQQSLAATVVQFALGGKKALLRRWREETHQALQQLNAGLATQWRDYADVRADGVD